MGRSGQASWSRSASRRSGSADLTDPLGSFDTIFLVFLLPTFTYSILLNQPIRSQEASAHLQHVLKVETPVEEKDRNNGVKKTELFARPFGLTGIIVW